MELLQNNPYSHIRGFNYCPSYMMVLNDVMDYFDPKCIADELKGAQKLGANCIRVWLSNVSWQRNPKEFLKNFDTLLSIADASGLSVMPALFNRWVDSDYPIGQLDLTTVLSPMSASCKEYVRSFIGSFAQDSRVLMWDLCNEPFFYFFSMEQEWISQLKMRELEYWLECLDLAKSITSQPLTIGFAGPADPALSPLYAALDVISFHPYAEYWNEGYAKFTDAYIKTANLYTKPLLCTETCQGSLNDTVRNEIIRSSLDVLQSRKIGWLAWHLCESKIVTGNRERTDENCRPGERGYMPFLLADGSIRPDHEIILNYTKI